MTAIANRASRALAFLRDVGEKVLHDIWRVFGYACERLMMLATYLVVGWRKQNLIQFALHEGFSLPTRCHPWR